MTSMFNPPHPGRILEESLEYMGVSARSFAQHIGVSTSTVTRILNEEKPITPDMAVRISAALPGPSPEVWLAIQAEYDVWQTKHKTDVSWITRYEPAVGETRVV